MNNVTELTALVHQHQLKRALIIDDAYDDKPLAGEIAETIIPKAVMMLASRPPSIKRKLARTLDGLGLEPDAFEDGFYEDDFVADVWALYRNGKLPQKLFRELFQIYIGERDSKRNQLEKLETFLSSQLRLEVIKQGTSGENPTPMAGLVFLDLYLGITNEEEAVDNAARRVKELLKNCKDSDAPLVLVMSTKGGADLEDVSRRLQAKGELMGCKFRAIHKDDFEAVLPVALKEMLTQFDDAQVVSRWLDAWSNGIEMVRDEFISKLRLLDLSDLAYLAKYRLEAEGVSLGTYLRSLADGFFLFCIERQLGIAIASDDLNKLDFSTPPPAHFLPSEQVPKLKHASIFVHDDLISHEGWQFEDARHRLQLGDVIISKPDGWKSGAIDIANETDVYVVISQACDIQHGRSDTLLLLKGNIQVRQWMSDLKPSAENTEVFIHNEQKFVISWNKAQIAAWSGTAADRKLSRIKKGGFLRIARFRDVEALKLQNIFASNLTRVGTLAAPHPHEVVGLELLVPLQAGGHRAILKASADDHVAALIQATKSNGPAERRIVFSRDFPKRIVSAIGDATWDQVKAQISSQMQKLAKSPDMLSVFRAVNTMNKPLVAGDLHIVTCWSSKVEEHKNKVCLAINVPK